MPKKKKYGPLSLSVDVALVSALAGGLSTLVVRRQKAPHRGRWALPGGFVHADEGLEQTCARVLKDKAGVGRVFLEQLYTFGDPRRDPRSRVVTVAYFALVDAASFEAIDTSDGNVSVAKMLVPWEGETGGPVELRLAGRDGADGASFTPAFDHADILGMVVKRMRGKLAYTPIGFQLLPEAFTLRELQRVHEMVLGHAQNKDSFRRKMLASGQLEATGERQHGVEHRPAELYRFVRRSAV
jgi:8-oxo-dGTP diphosphatase